MAFSKAFLRRLEAILKELRWPASQIDGEIPAANLGPSGNTGSGYTPAAHTHTASAITDFGEAVDDEVAALLVAGSNITLTYNDAGNTLTIAASGGGGSLTVEEADGEPTVVASKLVFPNGSLSNDSGVVTYTPPTAAPTTARYVVTEADGVLPNETTIPDLLSHADRAGVGGAGFAEEFSSASAIFTWTSAPTAEDYHTTVPSAVYVRSTGTTERIGTRSWSPSGDFDIRWKVSAGTLAQTHLPIVRAHIGNSGNTTRLAWQLVWNNSLGYWYILPLTYSGGSYAAASGAVEVNRTPNTMYLRITRAGSTITWWFSMDGILWTRNGSQSFSITVANAGLLLNGNDASADVVAALHWMRANV